MTVENQSLVIYKEESKDFVFTVVDDYNLPKDLTSAVITWDMVNRNTGEILITKATSSGIAITSAPSGICTVSLLSTDTSLLDAANWYYHQLTVVDGGGNESVVATGNFQIKATKIFNLGYLMPDVRLSIGDTDPDTYRYTDEWVRVAMIGAVKTLGAWWGNNKYMIDSSQQVYRNPDVEFTVLEPPIIYPEDERPIVLMSAIIILEGSLENSAWNLASWRDNEISFSNLEGGRIKNNNLDRAWNELKGLITPPGKKLALSGKLHLPGYTENILEY